MTGIALTEIITTINNVNDGSIYFSQVLMISPVKGSDVGTNRFNRPVTSTIDDSSNTAYFFNNRKQKKVISQELSKYGLNSISMFTNECKQSACNVA